PTPTPDPKPVPDPNENLSPEVEELNEYAKLMKDNLEIIPGMERHFYWAIKNNYDFYFDILNQSIVCVPENTRVNWNSPNFWEVLRFKQAILPSRDYFPANYDDPSFITINRKKIDFEFDEQNNIIFKFKIGLYQGFKKEGLTSTIGETANLGKILEIIEKPGDDLIPLKPEPNPNENLSPEVEELNEYAKLMKDNLEIISGMEKHFYWAIKNNYDFYFDYKKQSIICVPKNTIVNWNNPNFWEVLRFKKAILPNTDFMLVNYDKTLYIFRYSIHILLASNKKINFVLDEQNNIIFKFKIGLFKKDQDELASTVGETANLGKMPEIIEEPIDNSVNPEPTPDPTPTPNP
ncbi:hypothetical protein, partial [[Mycoplasma] anseris]